MNISAPFVRRPIGTIAPHRWRLRWPGGSPFIVLPVSPLPQVDYPTISVGRQPARRQSADHGRLGRHAA